MKAVPSVSDKSSKANRRSTRGGKARRKAVKDAERAGAEVQAPKKTEQEINTTASRRSRRGGRGRTKGPVKDDACETRGGPVKVEEARRGRTKGPVKGPVVVQTPDKKGRVRGGRGRRKDPVKDHEWAEAEVRGGRSRRKDPVKDHEWAEAEVQSSKKKKPKVQIGPEHLEPGAVVIYLAGCRGVIRDAFVPLDEFWVADEESGKIVRDDNGDIVHFKSCELELVAQPPIAPQPKPGTGFRGPAAGVVLIGTEAQMLKMLSQFGSPDPHARHEPHMLLAFPCNMCDGSRILETAGQGIDETLWNLAHDLRPDIHIALRTFHLRHAIQEIGSDLLKMEDFFLMTAITMPWSWEDIESVRGWWQKWRRDVCNQIDVGPIRGFHAESDATPEDTARRILGCECGVEVSPALWDSKVQANLRKHFDVELPLQFCDVNDGRIFVLLLPTDAVVTKEEGILRFVEFPDSEYLAAGEPEAEEQEEQIEVQQRESVTTGITIGEWEKKQDQFQDLPKVPADWLRIRSQKTGEVYFYNKKTKETTFEMPQAQLPAGWTKETSKTTGKTYYFHAASRQYQLHVPNE